MIVFVWSVVIALKCDAESFLIKESEVLWGWVFHFLRERRFSEPKHTEINSLNYVSSIWEKKQTPPVFRPQSLKTRACFFCIMLKEALWHTVFKFREPFPTLLVGKGFTFLKPCSPQSTICISHQWIMHSVTEKSEQLRVTSKVKNTIKVIINWDRLPKATFITHMRKMAAQDFIWCRQDVVHCDC